MAAFQAIVIQIYGEGSNDHGGKIEKTNGTAQRVDVHGFEVVT